MSAHTHFLTETLHRDARPAGPDAGTASQPRSHRSEVAATAAAARVFFLLTLERGGACTHAPQDPGPRDSDPRSHGAAASRVRSRPRGYRARGVRAAASRPHRRPAGLGPRERTWRPVTLRSSLTSRDLVSGRRHLAELSFKLARSAGGAQLAGRPAPAREGLRSWEARSSEAS